MGRAKKEVLNDPESVGKFKNILILLNRFSSTQHWFQSKPKQFCSVFPSSEKIDINKETLSGWLSVFGKMTV